MGKEVKKVDLHSLLKFRAGLPRLSDNFRMATLAAAIPYWSHVAGPPVKNIVTQKCRVTFQIF